MYNQDAEPGMVRQLCSPSHPASAPALLEKAPAALEVAPASRKQLSLRVGDGIGPSDAHLSHFAKITSRIHRFSSLVCASGAWQNGIFAAS